jgi:outer membrane lipase/esterase
MYAVPRFAFALATAIGISGAAAPVAAAPVYYTGMVFFGDSLTDHENLSILTGGKVPESPPYAPGRRSNGPVWSEHIAQDFADKGLPTRNLAYVYANAVTTGAIPIGLPVPVDVPDLQDQINTFKAQSTAGQFGARPLASLFFGANDVFQAIALIPILQPADPVAFVTAAAAAAAAAVVGGIDQLSGEGFNDFLVFTLPPLHLTPAFANTPAEQLAALGTQAFNSALANGLTGRSGITPIDMSAVFGLLLTNPPPFGLTNVREACFDPQSVSFDPDCIPDQWAFYDPVHPNRVVHAELANIVRTYVAPVPLPLPGLLLAGGLVLMGGLRLRARG